MSVVASVASPHIPHSCHVAVIFLLPADEEFDELCFEFGIELDEVVSGLF